MRFLGNVARERATLRTQDILRKDGAHMKDTIKTSRTAGYLEKIFRAVNTDWFGGELEEPIITIQSTPRAYGHVTVSKI